MLTGILPRQLTFEQENRLLRQVRICAPVYHMHRASKDATFRGGYPYLILSLLVLNGWDEHTENFAAPRGSLDTHEAWRKQVWESLLGWEFVPLQPERRQPVRVVSSEDTEQATARALRHGIQGLSAFDIY